MIPDSIQPAADFHFHSMHLRCPKCTLEQAGFLLCGVPSSIVPCHSCQHKPLQVLATKTQSEYFPALLQRGLMFTFVPLANQVTLKELAQKLGLEL